MTNDGRRTPNLKPRFDVMVCDGRMCTSRGSSETRAAAVEDKPDGCRVTSGGCFGLCDFGPNVVVRRYEGDAEFPSIGDDRLSLSYDVNESVYSGVDATGVVEILRSHVDSDRPCERLVVDKQIATVKQSPVSERIQALRAKRRSSLPPTTT